MVKILELIKHYLFFPYNYFKEKQRIKKRLDELRKKDPFIYK
jgi:hypothetical protein